MREYSKTISRELLAGLRPSTRLSRNQQFLLDCYNLKPTQYGLEPREDFTDPFSGSETVAFPFPQLFRGTRLSLLAGSTTLKQVTETVSPWSAAAVTTYNPASPASTKAITSGGAWQFVDLGDAWFLFNGSCVVYRTGMEALNGAAAKVFVQDSVTVQTGCYHKGRILTGGFNSANFWQAHWTSIFSTWKAAAISGDPSTGAQTEIGQNWILWSSIGGGDFPEWLFPQPTYTYSLAPTAERVMEKLRLGEIGWMMMPFQGTVRVMKGLGEHVIVYGDDGIAAVTFNPPSGDVSSTYGVRKLTSVGIAQRGAVAGSDLGHIFIDTSGELWTIDPSLNVRKIGFAEWLFPILDGTILVSFDEKDGHFYIAGNELAFVLTEPGEAGIPRLAQHPIMLTSLHFVDGGKIALFEETDELLRTQARIETPPLAFGTDGITTITQVVVDYEGYRAIDVRLYYRVAGDENWRNTSWQRCNKDGVAFIRRSGLEFRVALRALDYDGFYLNSITIKWQASDKRYIRGPGVGEAVT